MKSHCTYLYIIKTKCGNKISLFFPLWDKYVDKKMLF